MTAAQAHRGPDGFGVAIMEDGQVRRSRELPTPVGKIALGHNRLAIIDLSEGGHQPMRSSDGGLWIVYNGEIYNYRELREELESLGRQFRSSSDTEVLLEAYNTWGPTCVSRFNGMWAFAILDLRRRCLLLSRDRFGVKPLHIAKDGDRILFASEIKALLAARQAPPRLNRGVAAAFLRHGVVNATDETFFEGIRCFPPAHYAEIDLERPLDWTPVRFWALPDAPERGMAAPTPEEACRNFRDLFTSSVSLRMRSDVRVGSCLSGGLDSSSIVCVASRLRPPDDPMDTFTASFEDAALDERRYADAVNARVGARAHVTTPTAAGALQDWPALVRAQDEPFTSLSIYAQYCVMRLSRQNGVKVLLDGQGGDETLAGYRKYAMFHLRSLWSRRRAVALAGFGWGLLRRGDRGLMRLSEGVRYLPGVLRRRAEGLSAAIAPGYRGAWTAAELAREPGHLVEDRQVDDLTRYSLPSLLRYEDRNSMAFGIEARVPFLDYRLVEFLLRVSSDRKLVGGQTKAILRRALRGTVPDEILDRRDKLGFGPPQQDWLRGAFGDRMRSVLRSDDFRLRDLVAPDRVEPLLDASGMWAHAHLGAAFRVYSLDAWARSYDVRIDGA